MTQKTTLPTDEIEKLDEYEDALLSDEPEGFIEIQDMPLESIFLEAVGWMRKRWGPTATACHLRDIAGVLDVETKPPYRPACTANPRPTREKVVGELLRECKKTEGSDGNRTQPVRTWLIRRAVECLVDDDTCPECGEQSMEVVRPSSPPEKHNER